VCLIGDGPVPCEGMIVGEAPGGDEDKNGIPFSGKSGTFLRQQLEEIGLDPKTLFITNVVKCHPPKNKRPKRAEAKTCSSLYLPKEIAAVRPKVILLLGATAISWAKGEKTAVKKSEGSTFEIDGITYVPSRHPSAVLRGNGGPFKENLLRFRDALKKTWAAKNAC
jgi:uracil-DNA glycosylase family 4